MKNIELFNKMRKRANLDIEHFKKQKEIAEACADKYYKMWCSTAKEVEERDERYLNTFHEYSRQAENYQKLIEKREPFTKDKWYMSEFLYSDVHAYEVVEVYTESKMAVRRMKATEVPEAREARMESFVPGGFCGTFDNSLQEWTYESDESNPIEIVRRHKDGYFYRPRTRTCAFVPQCEPYEHFDFNF